ncbi:ABC transporter permease [Paenibacillus sp. DMB20]|uniref:ABC transporter permease n=1 Tax=Paenibacillus sp. DMB20 TaxID=1642570 RepID=UPI000627CB32|nr:ABC transporter permease [Paenibacillus sp. DMB20]KKO53182.1 transporter [Paenibacillus sp. DMB20]
MIRNECLKMVNKRIFILAYLGLIGVTIILSWSYINSLKTEVTSAQMLEALISMMGLLVITPWAIVSSPLIWTDEYQYGTLKQLFLHTSSRIRLYSAKIAAMILQIVTSVGCIFIVALLSNLLMAPQNMQWGDMTVVLYSSGALVLQCCLYASLASLIGVWTRSAAFGVGGSLAVYFIQLMFGSSLISTSWTHILFIHHDDLSLYWNTPEYKSELPGLPMSLAIDIAYILFFFAVGLRLFVKERGAE